MVVVVVVVDVDDVVLVVVEVVDVVVDVVEVVDVVVEVLEDVVVVVLGSGTRTATTASKSPQQSFDPE